MLGEERWLVAVDQTAEAVEMIPIEWTFAADRQRDAMQRQGIAGAKLGKQAMGGAALPHIVLGMDLEEIQLMIAAKRVGCMLGLEA